MATRRAAGASRGGSDRTDDAAGAGCRDDLPFENVYLPRSDGTRPGKEHRRGGCKGRWRPCRNVYCRYHLATDYWQVADGGMVVRVRSQDPDQPSCALDVADEGPQTSERIAKLLGISEQAVEQRLKSAIKRVRQDPRLRKFADVIFQDIE